MPKASRNSKKKTMVNRYNLRSRAKKLAEIMADEFVTKPLHIDEDIVINNDGEPSVQQPAHLLLIQNGMSDMNVEDTLITRRETAGSPVEDVEENMYNNAINLHFKEKTLKEVLPDAEEFPKACEEITDLKINIVFEYPAEVLDDILDEEEAKNAASCKFFKARYITPRVTKKRTNQ